MIFSMLGRLDLCRATTISPHKRSFHIVKYEKRAKKNRCAKHRFSFCGARETRRRYINKT